MRQISEDEVLKEMLEYLGTDSDRRNVKCFTSEYNPSDNNEPIYDQLKTYCNRRGMVIMTFDLFNEMKSRWGAVSKRGRWVKADNGDCCYKCSECGFMRDAYLLDVGNYCPQCGARMDF